jgi:hypothetical protein
MSFIIDDYDEHNLQLRIRQGAREISFSLASVKPEAHHWLGEVLDRQITELVEMRVQEALEDHKKKLRELIGAKA